MQLGPCGALCQDWLGIEVDPERVGRLPEQHISRPGAVFTEKPSTSGSGWKQGSSMSTSITL